MEVGKGGNGEGWKEHKLAREGEPGRKARSINEYEMTNHIYPCQKYFDNQNFRTSSRTQFTAYILYFPTAREGLCCKAEHHPCTGMFSLRLTKHTSAFIIYGSVSSSL